jgi:hypothetical protein
MTENLMCPAHKAASGKYRENWESTFFKRNISAVRKALKDNREEIVYGSDTETGRRTIKL